MTVMEIQQFVEIDIGQAIDVGGHKGAVDAIAQIENASPCVGVFTGIDQVDVPTNASIVEVIDDDFLPIAEGNKEFGNALLRVQMHYLPQDRFSVNGHHGLRQVLGERIRSGSFTTC